MTILQALVLGLLQGATEFIPISSSAHLTLVPWLLGWTDIDPGLQFTYDVMVHWGTLLAVFAVLGRDLWTLAWAGVRSLGSLGAPGGPLRGFLARLKEDEPARLAWLIVIGSIPAAVLGYAFESFFEMLFGTPRVVSLLLWVTAGLLAFSEWRGQKGRPLASLSLLDVLIIGLGQALSIAPGISRSGATIAAGLLRGIKRDDAARFSFWLGTPAILGAGLLQVKDLITGSGWKVDAVPVVVGFVAAAVAGYVCIRFLLSYLRRHKLYVFAIYCALLGTACLIVSLVR
jgi:undecaprenyl-diphosphatase